DLHSDQRGDVVPPRDAAPAPLVGSHRQRVLVLVGEAEHLLAAVPVFGFDDLPHLVRPRVAPIPNVLERNALWDAEGAGQVAGLSGAVVEDVLGGLVIGDDTVAEA